MSLDRSFQMSGSFHYQDTVHRYSQAPAGQVIFRKYYYNIFMVGNSGTGKTSIIRRLARNNIDKFYHQTMNQEIIRIDFEKQDFLLYLFDNPGRRHQQYSEESIENLECANAIVMVYDNQFVDNLKDSLIDDWIPDIQAIMQKHKMDPNKLDIIICCNKSDIELQQSQKQKKQKLSKMFEKQVSKIGLLRGTFDLSCRNQAQKQFINFRKFLYEHAFRQKITDQQQNKKLRQTFVSQKPSRPNSQIYIEQQQQIQHGPQTINKDSNQDKKQSFAINNKNQQIKENQINQNNLSGREKQVNIQNQNQKQKKKRKTNKQSKVNQDDQGEKTKQKEQEKQQKQKEYEIERKNNRVNQGKKQNETIMQKIQPNNNQSKKQETKPKQKDSCCRLI